MEKKVLLTILIGYTSLKLIRYIQTKAKASFLKRKALKKKLERDAQVIEIPKVEKSKQDYILSLHAFELSDAIKAGKITAVEATSTYILRAFTLGRQFHLTCEEPFKEALELAIICDKQLKDNPESCGSLHGVPISIKEAIGQKGYSCSAGCSWRLDIIEQSDALILEFLKNEGAIPFIRSNVPQAYMWMESCNDIYGRADNPWNLEFTPGGSSGGESGLIACRASPLGIGTDIGGSIRVPCAFTGIYGFKTTTERVSFIGIRPAHPSGINPFNFLVKSSIGPMGRCVDDLKLVLKIFYKESNMKRDPLVIPIPFNDQLYESTYRSRKLRIGYYYDLDLFECCPAARRCVTECRQNLELLGHTLIEFKFPESKKALNIYLRNINACGNNVLESILQGEEKAYFYKPVGFLNDYPWIKSILLAFLKLTNNNRLYDTINVPKDISPAELIALFRELKAYIVEFTNYWTSMELDVVISPAYGTAATPHKEAYKVISSLIYSSVWNLLGYPAGVVPIDFVRDNETFYQSKYDDLVTKGARAVTKSSVGLPMAIHVASLPFRDEIALAVMKQIEDIFQFHKFAH